jgi:hypothetical protein
MEIYSSSEMSVLMSQESNSSMLPLTCTKGSMPFKRESNTERTKQLSGLKKMNVKSLEHYKY